MEHMQTTGDHTEEILQVGLVQVEITVLEL